MESDLNAMKISEYQIILGWIVLEFNASDSRMVKKDTDELRSDLASNSSSDPPQ